MYGTVARMRVKPGMEERFRTFGQDQEVERLPGHVATYVYRMDADPQVLYLAVVFESKEAYVANASSPEQDARYQQLRALLERDPEWNDGDVVYAYPPR